MLKSIALAAAFMALAGCAQTPETRLTDASTTPKRLDPQCLQTGTRIRLGEGECAAVSGRAFSSKELEQTGAFSLSEALRKLDPSIGR